MLLLLYQCFGAAHHNVSILQCLIPTPGVHRNGLLFISHVLAEVYPHVIYHSTPFDRGHSVSTVFMNIVQIIST